MHSCYTKLFEIELTFFHKNGFGIKYPTKVDMPQNPNNQPTQQKYGRANTRALKRTKTNHSQFYA